MRGLLLGSRPTSFLALVGSLCLLRASASTSAGVVAADVAAATDAAAARPRRLRDSGGSSQLRGWSSARGAADAGVAGESAPSRQAVTEEDALDAATDRELASAFALLDREREESTGAVLASRGAQPVAVDDEVASDREREKELTETKLELAGAQAGAAGLESVAPSASDGEREESTGAEPVFPAAQAVVAPVIAPAASRWLAREREESARAELASAGAQPVPTGLAAAEFGGLNREQEVRLASSGAVPVAAGTEPAASEPAAFADHAREASTGAGLELEVSGARGDAAGVETAAFSGLGRVRQESFGAELAAAGAQEPAFGTNSAAAIAAGHLDATSAWDEDEEFEKVLEDGADATVGGLSTAAATIATASADASVGASAGLSAGTSAGINAGMDARAAADLGAGTDAVARDVPPPSAGAASAGAGATPDAIAQAEADMEAEIARADASEISASRAKASADTETLLATEVRAARRLQLQQAAFAQAQKALTARAFVAAKASAAATTASRPALPGGPAAIAASASAAPSTLSAAAEAKVAWKGSESELLRLQARALAQVQRALQARALVRGSQAQSSSAAPPPPPPPPALLEAPRHTAAAAADDAKRDGEASSGPHHSASAGRDGPARPAGAKAARVPQRFRARRMRGRGLRRRGNHAALLALASDRGSAEDSAASAAEETTSDASLAAVEEELRRELSKVSADARHEKAQQRRQRVSESVSEAVAAAAEDAGLWKSTDGQAGRCTRFLVLTMQRSGSTWLLEQLHKVFPQQVRTTFEAFNAGPGQSGNVLLARLGLTPWKTDSASRRAAMQRLGAREWAEYVWQDLETSKASWFGEPLQSPCAVGFKMMGPSVDSFNMSSVEDLLMDSSVKKIVLDRYSTHAQWLSRQWACWTNDFSSHSRSSEDAGNRSSTPASSASTAAAAAEEVPSPERLAAMRQDGSWKAWTAARAKKGMLCNVGRLTHFDDYKNYKFELFSEWRDVLDSSGQEWLELQTEGLDDSELMPELQSFLLRTSGNAVPSSVIHAGAGERAI